MLDTLGALTVWAGMLLLLVGGLAFIVVAFKESILWGLGVLFLPFVSLIFLILHWRTAKTPFFWQIGGFLLVLLGVLVLEAHVPFFHHHYHARAW